MPCLPSIGRRGVPILHARPNARVLSRAVVAIAGASLAAACAGNPAARRATLIADADRAAKAAVERESQLDVAKIPARTFSVLPFTVAMRDTVLDPLSFGLASLLVNDLATSPQLQLVERLKTDAILRELDLVDEGVVDPKMAPRVGRLVGARRLLIGDAARGPGNTIRLSARVVDVISGTVQDLVVAEAPLDRVIDAEKALALTIFEALGITLTPSQRVQVEQRQTTQLAALVAYGKGAEAEARGDATRATQSYQDAARLDASFSAARTQAAANTVAAGPRVSNLARVLELGAQGVNAPVTTKTTEVADAPIAAASALSLVFIIRVTP